MIGKDIKAITEAYRGGGLIIVEKLVPKMSINRQDGTVERYNEQTKKIETVKPTGSDYSKKNRHITSLESLVRIFRDDTYDKNKPLIKIDGKVVSLNEFFVSFDSLSKNPSRYTKGSYIFYGDAQIKSAVNVRDLIVIAHYKKGIRPVYTNRPKCVRRFGKFFKNKIDEDEKVEFYFRGHVELTEKGSYELKNYNDKVYKDILFLSK